MKKIILATMSTLKKIALIAIILFLLLLAGGVLFSFIDAPYSSKRAQGEQRLSALLQHIQIGDAPDVVSKKYLQCRPKDLEIIRDEDSWVIKMVPMGMFSESDWRLHIQFKENSVNAVYIRSVEGPYKPKGSPEDKGEAPPEYSPG